MKTERYEAEMCVLFAMLADAEARLDILEKARPDYFTYAPSQALYRAIEELFVQGHQQIEGVMVLDTVRRQGWPEGGLKQVGDYLEYIIRNVPSQGSYPFHLSSIIEAARSREVARLSSRLAALAKQEGEDARLEEKSVFAQLENLMVEEGDSGRMQPIAEFMQTWELPRRRDIPAHRRTTIPELDASIDIYRPGTLTVLAGRPGEGKSSLMRQLIGRMGSAEPVDVFSLEESREQMRDKFICGMAHLDYNRYSLGQINEEETGRAIFSADQLMHLNLRMHTKEQIGLPKVRIIARWHRSQFAENGAIWIDHIQLMDRDPKKNDNAGIAEITRGLKKTALETRLPILFCCQLNRQVERRESREPNLGDLRDSGALEADPDHALAIYTPDPEVRHEKVIKIMKNRHGPCTSANVIFTVWGEFQPRTTIREAYQP